MLNPMPEPKAVLDYFTEISQIPRESGNEKAISDYLMDFAEKHGLEAKQDEAFNVVIYKPGKNATDSAEPVILQSHMDMVCEKNVDSSHNFLTDPISLRQEEDLIYANGTTLGADNGIGMAITLAVLADAELAHPPIEAVFTSDEETGMSGMAALEPDWLTATRMLNLDSGIEGEICVGCAGGIRLQLCLPIARETLQESQNFQPVTECNQLNEPTEVLQNTDFVGDAPLGVPQHTAKPRVAEGGDPYDLKISGLVGGHSGTDIHLGRANANLLLARALLALKDSDTEIYVLSLSGGLKDNAIPREATALLVLPEPDKAQECIAKLQEKLLAEYRVSDPGLTLSLTPSSSSDSSSEYICDNSLQKILTAILLLPSGVLAMSQDISELVEASNNIGIVASNESEATINCTIRSSSENKMAMLCRQAELLADTLGAKTEFANPYPGWQYNPDSPLREKAVTVYEQALGIQPEIKAVHAGLECGLLLEKKPELDIISYGCNIFDMHTPNEHVSVSSLQRIWEFTKALLAALDS